MMKKLNNYRLQYWLYAILNKKFGKEVKFKRDSLHSRYEVNRHGFYITVNTLSLKEVKKYLKEYLEKCMFTEENNCGKHYKRDKVYISVDEYDDKIYCNGRVYG